MLIRPAFLLSATSMGSALASIALYGQCGSNDIVWADTCSDGLSRVHYNCWYSLCLPAESTTTVETPSNTGIRGTVYILRPGRIKPSTYLSMQRMNLIQFKKTLAEIPFNLESIANKSVPVSP
ncbi:hypothetical protein B0H13DRAFT_1874517 [Mycena leptocephala]|nr:hypothetical protein B0H13DRAFT_1874517 [Mycena leptocephala]